MFENISKNELRIKYKGIRNTLNVATINELSDRIMDRLYETEIFNTSKEILTFINTKSEVNTSKLINHCFEINKKVAVPKVMGDEMKFYYISSFKDVKPGTMNILEPNGNDQNLCIPSKDSLMIMPGLVFDKYGGRIGYGGGFYDKYIYKYSEAGFLKAALCFYVQIYNGIIPVEKNDISPDYIITDKEIIRINNSERIL